jgi:hypothetical protein
MIIEEFGKISAKKGKTKGRVVVDPALVDA